MKRIIGITLCMISLFALVSYASGETDRDKLLSPKSASIIQVGDTMSIAINSNDAKDYTDENEKAGSSIIIVEDNTEDIEPQMVEEETYYFEEADYTVNGLAVHFDSITLHRKDKPAGYSVFVSYQVENQNSKDATFAFSTLNGNCFEFNDKKTTLAAQATWSVSHTIKFHLKAGEKSEMLTGDFFAQSLNSPKTIDGTTYGPIDISELFTGQTINIELSMDAYVGDSKESMIVTFEIEL